MQNNPQKHHYIPVFYLRSWAVSNGELIEYSRPYKNKLVSRRKHPTATGYSKNLYSLKGFPKEDSEQIEKLFFSPVDNDAALALQVLLKEEDQYGWNSELRSAWTRFLVSLLYRTPADLKMLKEYWQLVVTSSSETESEAYLHARTSDAPATFEEFLKTIPTHEVAAGAFRVLMNVINGVDLGYFINNMVWETIKLETEKHELLTSDSPVIATNGLKHDESHLVLPLAPNKLFVAANSRDYIRQLFDRPPSETVKACNKVTVGNASKLVFSGDRSQTRFIANRFGQLGEKRQIQRAMDKWLSEETSRTFNY